MIVIALVGLVVAGVLFARSSGGDDDDTAATTTSIGASGGEIFLQPMSATGPDPFTQSVAAPDTTSTTSTSSTVSTTISTTASGPTTTASATAIQTVGGGTPGLFGGTRDQASCDAEKMVRFLEGDRTKAAAWASALGIAPTDIRTYAAGLTPVVLRSDTRVTNHGFKDGKLRPFQAVLQAGTAVLVDSQGVPRVRCACGNPLLPPVAAKAAPTYVGTKWSGFSPEKVSVVTPNPQPLRQLELVDSRSGVRFTQPVGSAVAPAGATTTSGPASSTTTTAAAASTPPTAGLQVWLAADQGVVSDGRTVSQWNDLSGGGRHATASSAASQPTLVARGVKGKPALRFDGVDDGLTIPVDINPTVAPNVTIYAVFASETASGTPYRKLYSHDNAGFDRTAGLDSRSKSNYSVFNGRGLTDYFVLEPAVVYQTTDIWGPTTFTGRRNGREVVSAPVANGAGATALSLGRNPSFSEFWMGPIAEVLVYVGEQSSGDRSAVERYLQSKYDL